MTEYDPKEHGMTTYHVDLSEFPAALHRIVKSWYGWHNVYLRKSGNFAEPDGPEETGTPQRISWGGVRPPRMTSADELCFSDDYELAYYLVVENNEYYIEKKSRGSRGRYWMFRRFEDA